MVKIEKRQADAGYDNSQHNDVSSSSFPPLPSSEGIINNVEDHEENPWRKIHREQQKAEVASTSTRPREPEYAVAAISRQSEAEDESSDEESEEEQEAPVFPQANEPAQSQNPEVIPPPDQPRPWTNQLEFMKTKMLPCLLKKKESRQFRQPMTSRYLKPRHYFEAVRYPMDFGTIRRRLNNKYYRSGSECVDDIMRIFKNANIYKPSPSRMSENAQFMENAFRKKMLDMPKVEEEVDAVRAQAKPKKEEEPEVEFDSSDTGRDHRGVSKRARKPVKHYGCNEVNDHPQPSTSAQARELERWKRFAALKPKDPSTGEAGASPKAPKRARYSDDQADKAKCDGNEKLRIDGVVVMLHHKVQKSGNEKKEEENGEVEQVANVKEQEETTETKMEMNRKIKDMKKEKGEPEQVEMNRRIKGMKREKGEAEQMEMYRKIKDMKKEKGEPEQVEMNRKIKDMKKEKDEVEMNRKIKDMKKEKDEVEMNCKIKDMKKEKDEVEMNRKIKDMKKEKDEVEMNRKIKDMKKEKGEPEQVEMNRKIKDMKKEKREDEVEMNRKIKDMKKEKEEDEVEMNRKIKDMKKEKEEDEVEMYRKIKDMKKEKDEVEVNRKIKDMKKEMDEVEMNRKIKDMKKEEDEDEAEKKDKNEGVEKGNEDSEMEDKEIKEKKDKEIEEREEEEGELMDI